MSISSAAKLGGAGTLAAGVPTTLYLSHDHIFFYEIERKIINEEVSLSSSDTPVPSPTPANGETFITTISYETNKWSCDLYAKLISSNNEGTITDTEKTKMKEYIKKNLAIEASTPAISDKEKKSNKRQLIWDCSKSRTVEENKNIKAKLIFLIKKESTENNKVTAELFGTQEEISTLEAS